MALLVTIFLMLVNISANEHNNGPITRVLTAMDVWLLLCKLFVALALLEYSVLLAILFGKQSKIAADGMMGNKNHVLAETKCHKIDRYALRAFLALFVFTMGTYFSIICSH